DSAFAPKILSVALFFSSWIFKANSLTSVGSEREGFPLFTRCTLASWSRSRNKENQNEKIYRIFAQNPPCPYIVQCYLLAETGIFMEYMRDANLSWRIQQDHTRDQKTRVVTKVQELEPLSLRLEWMNDLTQAVAFLESLNLAHGDLRPENVWLDRNKLKLSDFDCTAEIGTELEICQEPYGRCLNSSEAVLGECGTPGFLGPRTEQFALGSLYYYINYCFEVYGDQHLAESWRENSLALSELLMNMKFPALDGNPLIDSVINKCWHNGYATISTLAVDITKLLGELGETHGSDKENIMMSSNSRERDTDRLTDNSSKTEFCQDLEKRGLLDLLLLADPNDLGRVQVSVPVV
ncbi:hypothetical protein N7528_008802, partial [Penicillium herquei]